MTELIFMNTIKAFLSFTCYLGTGIIAIDEITEGAIIEALDINSASREISICLLIILLVLKICWFIYDKFYLERKERNLAMDKVREEIEDMKEKQ